MTHEYAGLTIALPKGKLFEPVLALLRRAGLQPPPELAPGTRRLIHTDAASGVQYLLARAADVPVYVEQGAADVGIAGKDVLLESGRPVYELLDLGVGVCRMVVAMPESLRRDGVPWPAALAAAGNGRLRIASKYPRIAREHLAAQGIAAEIIHLHGQVEMAPAIGLSDAIVDIVETGRTLAENRLVAVEDIFASSARLVANSVSRRLNRRPLEELVQALRGAVQSAAAGAAAAATAPAAGREAT